MVNQPNLIYLLSKIPETGLSSYWTRKDSESKSSWCKITSTRLDYYLACIPSYRCLHPVKQFQSQRVWQLYRCSHTEVPKRTDPHLKLTQVDNCLLCFDNIHYMIKWLQFKRLDWIMISYHKSGNIHVCLWDKCEVGFGLFCHLHWLLKLCLQLMNDFAYGSFERWWDLSVYNKTVTITEHWNDLNRNKTSI